MHELIQYINALGAQERLAFAQRCGTTIGYMRKAVSTGQKLRAETCSAIERESSARVTRRHLRPDDWAEIWPELANSEANPAEAPAQQAQAAIKPVAQGVAT